MTDIKSVIAKNISQLRTKSGMTQLELAESLQYSDKAVSKWERGESVPEIATLKAIAELFDVTLDYLVSEEHTSSDDATKRKPKRKSVAKGSIATATGMALVWALSLLSYVLLDALCPDSRLHWLCLACALPVCALIWVIFNSKISSKR